MALVWLHYQPHGCDQEMASRYICCSVPSVEPLRLPLSLHHAPVVALTWYTVCSYLLNVLIKPRCWNFQDPEAVVPSTRDSLAPMMPAQTGSRSTFSTGWFLFLMHFNQLLISLPSPLYWQLTLSSHGPFFLYFMVIWMNQGIREVLSPLLPLHSRIACAWINKTQTIQHTKGRKLLEQPRWWCNQWGAQVFFYFLLTYVHCPC